MVSISAPLSMVSLLLQRKVKTNHYAIFFLIFDENTYYELV